MKPNARSARKLPYWLAGAAEIEGHGFVDSYIEDLTDRLLDPGEADRLRAC